MNLKNSIRIKKIIFPNVESLQKFCYVVYRVIYIWAKELVKCSMHVNTFEINKVGWKTVEGFITTLQQQRCIRFTVFLMKA